MGALQYVDVPGYAAILLRRTYPNLVKAGGLIPRSMSWLGGTDAFWNGSRKMWTFPADTSPISTNGISVGGASPTIEFGTCQHEEDKYNFKSAEFQYAGFDEVTEFSETIYKYIGMSRVRKTTDIPVPLRTRGGTNPEGIGFDWVNERFVDPETATKRFIKALIRDNPSVDEASYMEGLNELDDVTRRKLADGDWTVRNKGPLFDRSWFEIVEELPVDARDMGRRVRCWDLAATPEDQNDEPDWTAGGKVLEYRGTFYILDMVRGRWAPDGVESEVSAAASRDGRRTWVYMEQEPGASGKTVIDHYARQVLNGFRFVGQPKRKNKIDAAKMWQPAAKRGQWKLLKGKWNRKFLDEVEAFPYGSFDDQVDTISLAEWALSEGEGGSRLQVGLKE